MTHIIHIARKQFLLIFSSTVTKIIYRIINDVRKMFPVPLTFNSKRIIMKDIVLQSTYSLSFDLWGYIMKVIRKTRRAHVFTSNQLFVGGFVFYLHYLCLFPYSGVQTILCLFQFCFSSACVTNIASFLPYSQTFSIYIYVCVQKQEMHKILYIILKKNEKENNVIIIT